MPRLTGAAFNATVERDARGRFVRFHKAGSTLSSARRAEGLAAQVLGTAAGGPKRQRESARFAKAGAALRAAKGEKQTAAGTVEQHAADIMSVLQRMHQERGGGSSAFVGIADLREALGSQYTRAQVDAALTHLGRGNGLRLLPIANRKALKKRDRDAALMIGPNEMTALIPSDIRQGPGNAELDRMERAASRDPRYNAMDDRELDSVLHAVFIRTEGMDREQKLDALAAHDQKMGTRRFSGDQSRPTTPVERTEISGAWKSGRSTPTTAAGRGRALADARAGRDEALRQLADGVRNAASLDQARAALSGLTVPELRKLLGVLEATFGARWTKARLIERALEIPGRRLDSDAIGRMGRQR